MFSSFSECIFSIGAILILFAPLIIQWTLYLISKKCFKKTSANDIYTICLVINTVLLCILKNMLISEPEEPMDAFDGLILIIIWSPWYIAVLISCIVRCIKASEDKKNEESEVIAEIIKENI